MNQPYFKSLLFALLALAVAACASGRRALEKGDYDKAVVQAVNRLRNDIDNDKALATLPKAYKLALQMHLENARRAKAGVDPLKWERVASEYQSLNYLHDEIRRCPACLDKVNPRYFQAEYNEAISQAAEVRYDIALGLMQERGDRQKAKEAYQHLIRANQLMPGFRDVNSKLDEALHFATLHVVVEPVPAPMGVLRLDQGFFNARMDEYLHTANISPYVRFYSPGEAEQLEWVDHRVKMEFGQFSLGNVISNTYEKEVSRDSVLLKGRGEKAVYGTVKATFKRYEKALVGSGMMEFQIEDVSNGRVINRERFPSQYRWEVVWASFNGDERALSEEQLELTRQRELDLPSPQLVFEQFAFPLYDQAIAKLSDFYRHY